MAYGDLLELQRAFGWHWNSPCKLMSEAFGEEPK